MKPEEYTAIKQEISATINIQHNYIIAMYTITAAFIGCAIEFDSLWLFIIPYLVLISFQRIVDVKKYHSLKLTAFLAVYSNDIWESNYTYFEEKVLSPTYAKSVLGKFRIVRVSSLHLGALCTILCVGRAVLSLMDNSTNDIARLVVPCIISVLLFFFLIYWCSDALDSYATRKKYVKAFKEDQDKCITVIHQS